VAEFIGRMNVVRGIHGHPLAGIRPEHIELVDAGCPREGHYLGEVDRCVFLGGTTRLTLRLDGQRVTLDLRGRRDDLVPGAAVAIRIPPHALLRLDDALA
jgi:hypothetical protein